MNEGAARVKVLTRHVRQHASTRIEYKVYVRNSRKPWEYEGEWDKVMDSADPWDSPLVSYIGRDSWPAVSEDLELSDEVPQSILDEQEELITSILTRAATLYAQALDTEWNEHFA